MMNNIIYYNSFDNGSGRGWTVGKNNPEKKGDYWHQNILGHYGGGYVPGWDREGGFIFSESPWYFDDNHGEFSWFHLVFRMENSTDAGIEGADMQNAEVDFRIRGWNLELKGTRIYFWIQGKGGHRGFYTGEVLYNWALTSQPVEHVLRDGRWHDVKLKLYNDESRWSQLGLINGGLARGIRVTQSRSAADGTLEGILGGKHWNWGLLLCDVDPLDQPEGRIDLDDFRITGQ